MDVWKFFTRVTSALVAVSLTWGLSFSQADDSLSPVDTTSFDSTVFDVVDEFESEVDETYALFRERVEAVWNEFRESTKQTWVDYSEDVSSLNEIDFKEGGVVLEAVIPVSEDDPPEVEAKIVERLKNCLSEKNDAGVNPLEGQLVFSGSGEAVDTKNATEYFDEELKSKLEKELIESQDGVSRYRYKVQLNLIPDHIKIRAEKYIPQVMEYSKKYQVDPALVLAVIHTESWFNPLAASHAGAYGLMQLIPRYGAHDSYRFVSGKSWVPTKEYLYIPGNNIQLGTAYLHMLQTERLEYKRDDEKRKYLAICAYNWGMGSINRKIIGKHDVNAMDSGELREVIKSRAPKETSDYLDRVLTREKIYEKMFE